MVLKIEQDTLSKLNMSNLIVQLLKKSLVLIEKGPIDNLIL